MENIIANGGFDHMWWIELLQPLHTMINRRELPKPSGHCVGQSNAKWSTRQQQPSRLLLHSSQWHHTLLTTPAEGFAVGQLLNNL